MNRKTSRQYAVKLLCRNCHKRQALAWRARDATDGAGLFRAFDALEVLTYAVILDKINYKLLLL